ncbi:MAG: ANTAR domain-containing protein [Eubacteriaceae bacterium]|nr:ANTAR domain-containing protein [Eubacteriaceae bacterium]
MMIKNVIVSLNNKKYEASLVNMMKQNGYHPIICDDGNTLIRTARSRNIDLIILDEDVKGFRTIDIVNSIYVEKICPILLVANQVRANYMDWIEKGWIYMYVSSNFDLNEMIKLVQSSIITGNRMMMLENEILKLKKTIADRKIIEKAKGIVMEMKKCSEDDAYKYLRTCSMEKKVSIENYAQAIINKFA